MAFATARDVNDFKLDRNGAPSIGNFPHAHGTDRADEWNEWYYCGPGNWKERQEWMDAKLKAFTEGAARTLRDAPDPDERHTKRLKLQAVLLLTNAAEPAEQAAQAAGEQDEQAAGEQDEQAADEQAADAADAADAGTESDESDDAGTESDESDGEGF